MFFNRSALIVAVVVMFSQLVVADNVQAQTRLGNGRLQGGATNGTDVSRLGNGRLGSRLGNNRLSDVARVGNRPDNLRPDSVRLGATRPASRLPVSLRPGSIRPDNARTRDIARPDIRLPGTLAQRRSDQRLSSTGRRVNRIIRGVAPRVTVAPRVVVTPRMRPIVPRVVPIVAGVNLVTPIRPVTPIVTSPVVSAQVVASRPAVPVQAPTQEFYGVRVQLTGMECVAEQDGPGNDVEIYGQARVTATWDGLDAQGNLVKLSAEKLITFGQNSEEGVIRVAKGTVVELDNLAADFQISDDLRTSVNEAASVAITVDWDFVNERDSAARRDQLATGEALAYTNVLSEEAIEDGIAAVSEGTQVNIYYAIFPTN